MSKRQNKAIFVVFIILLVVIALVFILLALSSEDVSSNVKSEIADDFVTVFDVGQADCSVISSNGKNFLVDTGNGSYTKELFKALKKRGIKDLDVLSISHYHEDHTGGLDEVLSKFDVENFILPPITADTKLSSEVERASKQISSIGGTSYYAKQGMTIDVGDFEVTVLYVNQNLSGENNRSVYMMAQKDGIKFLFTGDGEDSEESLLMKEGLNLDCDVLKVSHHGGSGATSTKFLNECTPKYAAISCGTGNMYGHPHKETLYRLDNADVGIYRTDQDGDITFFVNDGELTVKTEY